MTRPPDSDGASLRLLRADLDVLAHHLGELDRGTRLHLSAAVAELLERLADQPTPTARSPR